MKINVQLQSITEVETDVLVVGVFEGVTTPEGETTLAATNTALNNQITDLVATGDFTGRFKETKVLYPFGKLKAKRILLIGLGEQQEFTAHRARIIAATAAKEARTYKAETFATTVHGIGLGNLDVETAAQALAEGTVLGLYKVKSLKKKQDQETLAQLIVCEQDASHFEAIQRGIERGQIVAEGTNFARDLINTPSNLLTPTILAEQATDLATRHGIGIQILDEAEMREKGMNALLSIGQGSAEPSKLIMINYVGNPDSEEKLALVGKGITFDTGGYSLKPAQGMENMKTDMGGAGAVLGAMEAIARLKPKANIMAVVPAAENMVSGTAIKPGDVVVAMNGKSFEIVNTDAEGRVVLADALTYAVQNGATKIVDVATLTGAIALALGRQICGFFSNDGDFTTEVKEAFRRSGERGWEMPLIEEYAKSVRSDVADMKNSGQREGGAIVAALILREFVENTPWVHIDIAGVARDVDGGNDLNPRGATGFGVRTLVELAENQGR